jgi:hypothetical protein
MRAEGRHQTGGGLAKFAQERPLLLAGLGIFVGMALGALLPWSAIDEELLGEQGRRLKDSAVDLASDGYDRVRSAAQTAYGTAADALGGSGGDGENGSAAQSGYKTSDGGH